MKKWKIIWIAVILFGGFICAQVFYDSPKIKFGYWIGVLVISLFVEHWIDKTEQEEKKAA